MIAGIREGRMEPMSRSTIALVIVLGVVALSSVKFVEPTTLAAPAPAGAYFPERDRWEVRAPRDVGMDAALLAQAVEYAKTRDSAWGKADYMADQVRTFGRPMGQVPPSHGPTNGVIIRHGYIVAEFGDTNIVEPKIGRAHV